MERIRNNIIYKLKNKDGEFVVDTFMNIIMTFILCMTVITILSLLIHFYSLHYTAKAVTRTIEREGGLTNATYELLTDLNKNFKTSMTLTSRIPSKVQYMDSFTVVIEDTHKLTFATPLWTDPLEYDLPMRATITGKSEVYWKELL